MSSSSPQIQYLTLKVTLKVKPHAIYRFNGVYHIIMFATLKKKYMKILENPITFSYICLWLKHRREKKEILHVFGYLFWNEKEKCLGKFSSSFFFLHSFICYIDGLKYKCTIFYVK